MWCTVSPNRTVVTSFSPRRRSFSSLATEPASQCSQTTPFEDGDWVVKLASPLGGEGSTVACALSNGEIQAYDQETLHRVRSFFPPKQNGNVSMMESNHASFVEDLAYDISGRILVCARRDGSVQAFDLRTESGECFHATLPKSPNEAALSVAVGYDEGSIIAVGSNKARIHFFDRRQYSGTAPSSCLLGSYTDSHRDDVICLKFHPLVPSILLSGSEDGLACIFDTTQPTESMALKSVINVGSPLRKVGFCAGPSMASPTTATSPITNNENGARGGNTSVTSTISSTTVYCMTGSETMSLWHGETGTCLQNFAGSSLRQHLSESIGQAFTIDYLIDAHWVSSTQELFLTAGTNVDTGDAAIYRLTNQNSRTFEPCCIFRGGHRGVIRATVPLAGSASGTGSILTAGEDARLCEWPLSPMPARGSNGNHEHLDQCESPDEGLWKRKTMSLSPPVHRGNATGSTSRSGPVRRQRPKSSGQSSSSLSPY
jgi:WD40 repeat protein